ncbi:MAG: FGGY family carbohydrate kinase [Acidobacteriaceae bacterium]
MLLLGVDLGTTTTKAALYDLDGRLVSEGRAEVPLHHPRPGTVEQEMEDFYQSAATAIRGCMGSCNVDPTHVAGMAFDSQMAGIGGIDEFGKPAMRFDSWLDSRCQPYIEEIDRNFGDRVIELTGCPVTCNHAPKMLWWAEERPAEYKRIAKFVMPSSYVAGRAVHLRVEDTFIDPTFLHFTGVSDAASGTWSEELCSALGVDAGRLPRITEPWTVIGELSPESARDFGIKAGIPVAAGCGDTAAGALGAGIVRPGMLLDTAGTASVLAGCTDRFVADTRHKALMVMRSVVPGIWNPLAYVGGGGLAPSWFGRLFSNGHPEGVASDEAYAELFAQAADVPAGCDGLQFCPHLGGRVCPAAPEMRGAWIGFSWTHTRKHFFRAILESVGYEYAWYLRILRELAPELRLVEARVIGGGAKSETWNQIKADILSVPYVQLPRREWATLGSALIAGKASGLISNLAEAATELVPRAGTILSPNPALRTTYDASLERYLYWQLKLKTGFENHGKDN